MAFLCAFLTLIPIVLNYEVFIATDKQSNNTGIIFDRHLFYLKIYNAVYALFSTLE
ncbi:hypothetical protein PAGA_a1035 [Pseudoalteromonas agarivorans DSM 14585]|uniref:Uncharacterized protein n=1 Tax=Pseudoalteromonas agarivorans DSM 14585 TaxID=1312369 RepID=A0ACA8DUM4_9GAMM|nr:hypothetical protein PAGA_a1035 [Pseudoalteromonas agarivorans DSM 14585]